MKRRVRFVSGAGSRRVLLLTMLFCSVVVGLGIELSVASPVSTKTEVTRLTISVDVQRDGSVNVVQDFDMDFSRASQSGPILLLETIKSQAGSVSPVREYRYDAISVTSATGAPTELNLSQKGDYLVLTIGEYKKDVQGTQSYRVSYRLDGAMNTRVAASKLDEFAWNIIPSQWNTKAANVTVTVTGPSPVADTACSKGTAYGERCSTSPSVQGSRVTYKQDVVESGEGLTIMAGWNQGAVAATKPVYRERQPDEYRFQLEPWTLPWTLGASVLVIVILNALVKRKGDVQFAHVPPGVIPVDHAVHPVEFAHEVEVPTRAEPPTGIRPFELYQLMRVHGSAEAVTSMWLDLAIRGYQKIVIMGPGRLGFQALLNDSSRLTAPDLQFLRTLFRRGAFVPDDVISVHGYGAITDQLYYHQRDTPLFKKFRHSTRPALGVVLLLGSIVSALLVWIILRGYGMALSLPLFVALAAVGMAFIGGEGRNAYSRAIVDQGLGFQQFLANARSGQAWWTPGPGAFSQYLPYAIVVGGGREWVALCRDYARRQPVAKPRWLVGTRESQWATDEDFAAIAFVVERLLTVTLRLQRIESLKSA